MVCVRPTTRVGSFVACVADRPFPPVAGWLTPPSDYNNTVRDAVRDLEQELALKTAFARQSNLVDAWLTETTAALESEGLEHRASVPLGAMIEVPAAALVSQHFARELDFLSIGTNDLIQYSLAVDRNNEQVAVLYQPDHPAVLRLLAQIMRDTRTEDCEISICGEMAADPVMTPFLLGIGLRCLSMSSRSIPIIKERIRALDVHGLDATAEECLAFATAADVRQYLVEKHPVAKAY